MSHSSTGVRVYILGKKKTNNIEFKILISNYSESQVLKNILDIYKVDLQKGLRILWQVLLESYSGGEQAFVKYFSG